MHNTMSLVTASIQHRRPAARTCGRWSWTPHGWVTGSRFTAACARRRRPAARRLSDGSADPSARRQYRCALDARRVRSRRARGVGGPRTGPLSRAHRVRAAARDDGGTRFDYRNEFHAPFGPFGAIVSRALVGGMPEREATPHARTAACRSSVNTTIRRHGTCTSIRCSHHYALQSRLLESAHQIV